MRGSYGTFNSNPVTATNVSGGRQGADITSIDISGWLTHNQTSAYALGTTTSDDYTISSLALQIQVGAPILSATKLVNGLNSVHAMVGDTATFSFTITNKGTAEAYSVVMTDLLEAGLSYLPGSFQVNGVAQADPNLGGGVSLGDIAVNGTLAVQFQVLIESYPAVENVFYNAASLQYDFQPCQGNMISLVAATNQVEIILPCLCICCPRQIF